MMNPLRIVVACTFFILASLTQDLQAHVWIDQGVATGDHSDSDAGEGTATAMWGDLLVVGAPNLNKPASFGGFPVANAGGVQVYRRNSAGWVLDQTFYSPLPATGARFGASVAISENVIVVGEPYYTSPNYPANVHNGRALVYVYSPAQQKFVYRREIFNVGYTDPQYQNLRAPEYGTSVDVVTGPGGRTAVAIGAPGEDVPDYNELSNHGAVFADEGAVLVMRFKVQPDGTVAAQDDLRNRWVVKAPVHYAEHIHAFPHSIGSSVALSRTECSSGSCLDRYFLAAGSPASNVYYDEGFANGESLREDAGSAWLFTIDSRSTDTTQFDVHQEDMLVATTPAVRLPFFLPHLLFGDEHSEFGTSVDVRVVNGDAELIIGAPFAQLQPSGTPAGSGYFFRRIGGGCCLVRAQTIVTQQPLAGDGTGALVAFADGRLLVGAPHRQHASDSQFVNSGSVFSLEQASGASSNWAITDELDASPRYLTGAIAGSQDWIAAGAPAGHGATATWQRGWNVSIEQPQHGRIQIFPGFPPLDAVMCPPDCDFQYENGRHLQPIAIPDSGFMFGAWTGGVCENVSNPICPLTMDSDKTFGATFALDIGNTRTLTLEIAGGSGTISADASDGPDLTCPDQCDGIYPYGTAVSLHATPGPGYEFSGWDDCPAPGGNTCALIMNTWRHVTARFEPVAGNNELTIEFAGSGIGVVAIDAGPNPVFCIDPAQACAVSLPPGQSATIEACRVAGSTFAGWSNACSGSGACSLVLDTDKHAIATFDDSDQLFRSGWEVTLCPQGSFP